MGYKIRDLSYEQCESIINENTIVVLPIGGSSKEHGNHLPMGTDFIVTDFIANEVVKQTNIVLLETLAYAYFPAFVKWKGSVSIEANNFINFVKDIILSFEKFGVKKFVIIDGGVSTHIPLKVMAGTMLNDYEIKVAVTNILGLGKEVQDRVCSQKKGGHGDESETSCMLYINDTLVNMDKTTEEYVEIVEGSFKNGIQKVYVPARIQTKNGTNGNSTLATKEKGEKIVNAMIEDIVTFINHFQKV